jgi:phage baseplate assembly protein W
MAHDDPGSGFSFPLRFARGRLVPDTGEALVRRSLWLLLATSLGERVARPDYGGGLHDLVFAPATGETLGRIARAVEHAIVTHEPRVAVDRVSVAADPREPGLLNIDVEVTILATVTPLSFVFPFHSGGARDGR